MSIVDRNLNQDVTWWKVTGVDGFGKPSFDSPITFKGRWENVEEMFFSIDGEELRSNAVVFVDRDMNIGDFLFLGTSTTADPFTVTGTMAIRDFRKVPSLNALVNERRAIV